MVTDSHSMVVWNIGNTWCGQRLAQGLVNDLTVAKIQGVFLTPAPNGVMMWRPPYAPSRSHGTPYTQPWGNLRSTVSLGGYDTSLVGAQYRRSQHKSGNCVRPPPWAGSINVRITRSWSNCDKLQIRNRSYMCHQKRRPQQWYQDTMPDKTKEKNWKSQEMRMSHQSMILCKLVEWWLVSIMGTMTWGHWLQYNDNADDDNDDNGLLRVLTLRRRLTHSIHTALLFDTVVLSPLRCMSLCHCATQCCLSVCPL